MSVIKFYAENKNNLSLVFTDCSALNSFIVVVSFILCFVSYKRFLKIN